MLQKFFQENNLLQIDTLANRFSDKAYNWMVSFGPRLGLSIILFFIGEWLIRLMNKWIGKLLMNKRMDATIRPFLENILNIIFQILLILGIMQVLGIQMTIFAAVIAAFGVAAGLALSGTLQNFASGVLIILLKPFRVGDNINTQGQEGTVTMIRIFYTTILTYSNTTLIVPNSKLSNEVIFNLSRQGKRRLDIDMKFHYDVDVEAVKNLIVKTMNGMPECLKDPAPRIGVDKLEIDGFTIVVNVWANSHGFYDTKLSLQEKIIKEIKEAGFKLD
jgi:small conductance mechanosensitive channel